MHDDCGLLLWAKVSCHHMFWSQKHEAFPGCESLCDTRHWTHQPGWIIFKSWHITWKVHHALQILETLHTFCSVGSCCQNPLQQGWVADENPGWLITMRGIPFSTRKLRFSMGFEHDDFPWIFPNAWGYLHWVGGFSGHEPMQPRPLKILTRAHPESKTVPGGIVLCRPQGWGSQRREWYGYMYLTMYIIYIYMYMYMH